MIDLNTPMQKDACPPHIPSGAIPVLSTVMPEAAVSQAMRDALDARAQKKADWMSLESDLRQALLPELERLTTELVRVGLREAWRKRFDGI
jgi:hypothetical protein